MGWAKHGARHLVEVLSAAQLASPSFFSRSGETILCVDVIGEVSNPQLVKEEVVSARELVFTSRREEGGCVSNRRSTR